MEKEEHYEDSKKSGYQGLDEREVWTAEHWGFLGQ